MKNNSYIIESPQEGQRLEHQSSHPQYSLDLELPAGSVQIAKDSTVLDAGCGTGLLARHLLKQTPHPIHLIGVDASTERLEQAKTFMTSIGSTQHDVRFIEASLDKIPLSDQSIDHVFARYVFQHLSDPGKVTQELARVLKIGGKITVIDIDGVLFNLQTQNSKLQNSLDKLRMVNQQIKAFSPYVCKSIPRLFRQAGIQTTQITPHNMIFASIDDREFEAHLWSERLNQARPLIEGILGPNEFASFSQMYLEEILKGDELFYYTKFVIHGEKLK